MFKWAAIVCWLNGTLLSTLRHFFDKADSLLAEQCIAGSIDSARWAGIDAASSPINAIAKTTSANTSGSHG
jgi:hypothetical protein